MLGRKTIRCTSRWRPAFRSDESSRSHHQTSIRSLSICFGETNGALRSMQGASNFEQSLSSMLHDRRYGERQMEELSKRSKSHLVEVQQSYGESICVLEI